jgi:hypothetical protein
LLPLFACSSIECSMIIARISRRVFATSVHYPCSLVPSGRRRTSCGPLCTLLLLTGDLMMLNLTFFPQSAFQSEVSWCLAYSNSRSLLLTNPYR